MNPKRTRNVFLWAIALSILVHFLFAGYIRWPVTMRSFEETRIARIHITTIARVVPHTPPPPAPAAKSSIAPPSLAARGRGPKAAMHNAIGPLRLHTPAPSHTPTPLPTPASRPSLGPCGGHQNTEPSVQATPDAVDIPPDARASKVSGTAQISVSLDPQGRVTDTALAQSSGNAGLDTVADRLARATTYSPKYVNCRAVAGQFVFSVNFSAL
ncbi:MAG: energy transducer TonB [Candidatus Baltobacteraceae bacterium]